MKKDQLKQYRDLQSEIKRLQNRINGLEVETLEHDFVTGSNSEFPYQPRQFEISGLVDNSDKLQRLRNILKSRIETANDLKLNIETWIASIPDSRTRMIFEMRYIENKSWVFISNKFRSQHESYARKLHDRYLN